MVSATGASAMRHARDTASIKPFHRLYISWGYTKAWYSTSDIYFKGAFNGNSYNFVVTNAIAHDRPDMHALFPQVTVPQYVYRIGYFFDRKREWAIEFNFDHTKYIVDNYRTAHVEGVINGQIVNRSYLIAILPAAMLMGAVKLAHTIPLLPRALQFT